AAPGEDILSTVPAGDLLYDYFSGTSMAAPHVSGVLALLRQRYPSESVEVQKLRLLQSSHPWDFLDGRFLYAGVPDLRASLALGTPLVDFQFTRRLPEKIVRFRGQMVDLAVELENADETTFRWLKGNRQDVPGGSSGILKLEDLQRGDSGAYKVVIEKEGLRLSDTTFLEVIEPNLPLHAALDTNLDIGHSGSSRWRVSIDTAAVGPTSVTSGNLGDNESSSLYTYAEGEGTLSFFWKVSSEEGYDFLNLIVNGETLQRISGEKPWEKVDVLLSGPGLKIVEWQYGKDPAVSENSDNAHVDGIRWSPASNQIPVITRQPVTQVLNAGSTARFEVDAVRENLTFQWYKAGVRIAGANDAVLEIPNVTEATSGFYRVEVSNEVGIARSRLVELKVGEFPAAIVVQPTSKVVREGLDVAFEVVATGTEPIRYQWFKDALPIPDEALPSLVISGVSADDVGAYHVEASNAYSALPVASQVVSLNLDVRLSGPRIVKQPISRFAPAGQLVRFQVVAEGSYPLYYQWYFNDLLLSGENASTLLISDVDETHIGAYYCEVWNEFGTATSEMVSLHVIENIGNAIEAPQFDWETNHAEAVVTVTDPTYDGTDALKISPGPGGIPTYIKTTVEGPVKITFRHLGDTISPAGDMLFVVDGNPKNLSSWIYGFFGEETFFIEEAGVHEIMVLVSNSFSTANLYVDQFTIDNLPFVSLETDRVGLPWGQSFNLPLEVISKKPFSVQWYRNGSLIPGAVQEYLHINKATEMDTGIYHALVTNEFGSRQSEDFEINVLTETAGKVLDLESLAFEYEGEGFWYPQTHTVKRGGTALASPPHLRGPSFLKTKVRGPISGEFWGTWGVQLVDVEMEQLVQEDSDPYWSLWRFHLPENKEYELQW
ncbi:MAG: immunoglobulin domain-containing protein, partial [Verrucomicrobiae bacterium]|nr:immunoglobulin domain-containing protein [Verrucomicrobiae bacterium]